MRIWGEREKGRQYNRCLDPVKEDTLKWSLSGDDVKERI